MFKENKRHEIPELFSEKNMMPECLKKHYEKSWANGFYEDVFSRIDETIFEILFSEKTSRPNTPVNIYVSLEILKELFGLSDEQLFERFRFDNLFIFALGLNRMGDRTLSDRAFYYMRRRVVDYEDATGINLFEKVFKDIKDEYIEIFGVSQKIKRIDSTLIGSNIRRLKRITLFVEVLRNFVNNLDESTLSKLSSEIADYKQVNTESYVYSMNREESKRKINEIGEHLYRVMELFRETPLCTLESYQMLARVVTEHLSVTEQGKKVELKAAKELSSNCLQSPYDPDATYRKKATKVSHGYSVSIAETCLPDNELQIITDVIVEKNNVDDGKILADNFDTIMGDETEQIITDGGYLNSAIQEKLTTSKKTIVTTAIRGRKPDESKLSSTDFEIEDGQILRCPNGMVPIDQNNEQGKIVAHFSHESCATCQKKCIIRKNKRKEHVLEITKEKLLTDMARAQFNESEYLRKCRLRPAVEGTMFQLKLHLRNGKSKYRGIVKVRFSSIARAIGINFKRALAYRVNKGLCFIISRIRDRFKMNYSLLWTKFKFQFCNY